MKKFISLILCFALVFTGSSIVFFAVGSPEIRFEDVECYPGDRIEIPIVLANNPGFAYLELTPVYSPELSLASVSNGSMISDFIQGKQYVWVSDEDMVEDGVLATLIFNIGESVTPGEYKTSCIVRTCGNYDEETVNFSVISGKVTVKDKTEPKRTITVASTNAAPGEEVSLDVVMSGNPGINTFALNFDYDTDILALQSVTVAEELGGQFAYSKKAVWLSSKDVKYNGTILTAKFKVLESANNGDTVVSVTYSNGDISNYNEDNVDFELVGGRITIERKVCPPHSYADILTPPTCVTEGYTTHVCELCGASYVDNYAAALGHNFTKYVSDNNATCTEDGTKTAKCDRCDVTDTIADEGSKLGHSFTEYVSDNNATCTEDGTKTAKCDRCDVTDTIDD